VPACLRDLRERGIRIAIAGNQPRQAAAAIDALGLPVDVVATSAGLGVAKPDPAFFRRLSELLGQPPGSIASVGDRVDNDVLPAQAAGLVGIHLRRGPWGAIHSGWPEAARADGHLVSLEGLGERLLG
jgi:FMN phosphatase YigB (HAD superfamily)